MNDELQIFRGKDFVVSDNITIHCPTLSDICEYGEQKYFNMVSSLTSVGADLKWQLYDAGVDYTTVDDFELFSNILIKNLKLEDTSIIFGDLDFSKFGMFINTSNNEKCMAQEITIAHQYEKTYGKHNRLIKRIMKLFHIKPKFMEFQEKKQIIIDGYTYHVIVDYVRKVHGLHKNAQVPANESTKMILIEDAREEYLRNKDKEYNSNLFNLISAMVNSEGFKYNYDTVWNMKINTFLDSVSRIKKIKDAELLLQSGYSGYGISLKDIDKKQLNWLGELD